MPDRRRRTALHLPPPTGPVLLLRERQSSTGASGSSGPASGSPDSPGSADSPGAPDDNPFAPPPPDRPDQPWRPRHPEHGNPADGGDGSDADRGDRGGWGSQWSSRQPGRSSGGFGSRLGGQNQDQNGQNGPGNGQDGQDNGRGGLRWDPTDPAQRRARYALLSGMWAFFFVLFDFPEIALLLGALGLYWGISSLRAKASSQDGTRSPAAGTAVARPATQGAAAGTSGTATPPGRQQRTAAVSGIVTAALALALVAVTFSVQLAYRDYYTCVDDSLTQEAQVSCNDHLPKSLRPVFGVKE